LIITNDLNHGGKKRKDLNDQLRASWLKAVAAIELRNFGYAIDLLQDLLRREPEFLTGRQMLRRAEVTRAKTEKKGFFNISTAPLAVMETQPELKKNPRKTIELTEKVLETGPYNPQANMLLKDAAMAADYPEVAIFTTAPPGKTPASQPSPRRHSRRLKSTSRWSRMLSPRRSKLPPASKCGVSARGAAFSLRWCCADLKGKIFQPLAPRISFLRCPRSISPPPLGHEVF
jgi:hypothetical protein